MVPYLTCLNVLMAVLGLCALPSSFVSDGFLAGVPLFCVQFFLGLVPAKLLALEDRLAGRPKWVLVGPAMFGAVVWAVVAVVSLFTWTGC